MTTKIEPYEVIRVGRTEPLADDHMLRRISAAVEPAAGPLQEVADRMYATMKHNRGIGISAIQVGLPIRMVVAEMAAKDASLVMPARNKLPLKVMLNPRLENPWGEALAFESCLSIPDTVVKIGRAETVKLVYQDLQGTYNTEVWLGWHARLAQHELDHLDGVLIRDKIRHDSVTLSDAEFELLLKGGVPEGFVRTPLFDETEGFI